MLPVVCTSLCSGAWEQWIKAILNGRTIWMKRGGGSIDENLCNTCWYTSSSLSRLMIAVTITRWAWGCRPAPCALKWGYFLLLTSNLVPLREFGIFIGTSMLLAWIPGEVGHDEIALSIIHCLYLSFFLPIDEQHLFWSQFVTTRYLGHLLKAAIWSV